ncbi:MAG: carboxymuconolactone decarboxylase family protein [Phycisphaeraceae bacterium]|nr:carboxymuconolactone decarboxylase family protein [Phycisphaeraceae bacterium]
MKTESHGGGKMPGTFRRFAERFPDLVDAHERIAQAVDAEGQFDARIAELIKIGICLGAGLESALRSHVRKATQAGAGVREIEQAIIQGMNTVGFPRTVAAWSWAHEQFERDRREQEEVR